MYNSLFIVQSTPVNAAIVDSLLGRVSIDGHQLTIAQGSQSTKGHDVAILVSIKVVHNYVYFTHGNLISQFSLFDGVDIAFQSLVVIVNQANGPPVFDMDQFTFSLPENSNNDYVVGSVSFDDECKTTLYNI